MARTNISVDQTVFDEFSSEAERQNKTLFAFANESLLAVSKISAEGGNPSNLYHMWRTVTLLREMDVVTLPSDFIDGMIAQLSATDKPALLKSFHDLGSRLSGVLKIAADDLNDLEEVAKDFAALLPIKEFKTKNNQDGSVEIDIVGAGRKIESTECVFEFVDAVLNGYGYRVMKKDINIGTIMVLASKKSTL